MEQTVTGIAFLVFMLVWLASFLAPVAFVGLVIYLLVKRRRGPQKTDPRVATPFLSPAGSRATHLRCSHCDSLVDRTGACPNCGAPLGADNAADTR
ncbi:MAG: hypothetical protein KDA42_14670 [Planctomycetales bacterium]|nr:hypothetical protein [Planctomycetales bacterium]